MGRLRVNLESAPTKPARRDCGRGWFRRISALAAILIAVGVLFLAAFRNLGKWLEIDEPLQHAQAIAVLGGGLPFRAMEAAKLYNAGWADEVWLTQGRSPTDGDLALEKLGLPPAREDENSRLVLLKLGVPSAAIRVVPGYVENTVTELGAILRYEKSAPSAAVILIGSKAQARRVRIIWNAVSGGGRPAIVRYPPNDPFDPSHWWSNSSDALEATREAGGIVNAWMGFRIAPRKQ
jgi:hypothetical protein